MSPSLYFAFPSLQCYMLLLHPLYCHFPPTARLLQLGCRNRSSSFSYPCLLTTPGKELLPISHSYSFSFSMKVLCISGMSGTCENGLQGLSARALLLKGTLKVKTGEPFLMRCHREAVSIYSVPCGAPREGKSSFIASLHVAPCDIKG